MQTRLLWQLPLCRYQLCLFCFDRIKLECGNLCPGCRMQYGSEKDPFQKRELKQRGRSVPMTMDQAPQKPRPALSQGHSLSALHAPPPPSPNPGRRRHNAAPTSAGLGGSRQPPAGSHQPTAAEQHSQGAVASSTASATPKQRSEGRARPGASPQQQEHQDIGGETQVTCQSQNRPWGMPWQSALHGAVLHLTWGRWRWQKRRLAEPAPDQEVGMRAEPICGTAVGGSVLSGIGVQCRALP